MSGFFKDNIAFWRKQPQPDTSVQSKASEEELFVTTSTGNKTRNAAKIYIFVFVILVWIVALVFLGYRIYLISTGHQPPSSLLNKIVSTNSGNAAVSSNKPNATPEETFTALETFDSDLDPARWDIYRADDSSTFEVIDGKLYISSDPIRIGSASSDVISYTPRISGDMTFSVDVKIVAGNINSKTLIVFRNVGEDWENMLQVIFTKTGTDQTYIEGVTVGDGTSNEIGSVTLDGNGPYKVKIARVGSRLTLFINEERIGGLSDFYSGEGQFSLYVENNDADTSSTSMFDNFRIN
jgi:hypothetical protein